MSGIKIERAHGLDLDGAKAAAEQVAASLGEKFNVQYAWDQNTIRFKGAGAKGFMRVSPDGYSLEMQLGLLLRPFKSRIEQEIHDYMDQHA